MAYNFLKDKDGEDAPQFLLVLSCSLAGIGLFGGSGILTVISSIRLYNLKYPLRRIGAKKYVFFTSLGLGLNILLFVLMFEEAKLPGKNELVFNTKRQFLQNPKDANPQVALFMRALMIINVTINILVCGLTGYVLCPRKSKKIIVGADKSCKNRSAVTIFYMTSIYSAIILYQTVIIVLVFTLDDDIKNQKYFQIPAFIGFPFSMLYISMLNPLVMICRGQEMRSYASSLILNLITHAGQTNSTAQVSPKLPAVSI
jgi:hypothetical protein